ncbi:hypothetical protein [uncultured Rhodoblastus sp.]|uniref:hypothetical protein n=1 Tax=uncultured Rhodoblastus sp. TaxID=543037 RepID=UPI0025D80912|nr:hypothetical protein [uncultured Rhodoblastus sp.]
MGEVKPFCRNGRTRARSAPPEGPAQILFFLGVRYHRQEDHPDRLHGATSANGPDQSSGRRRSGGTGARRKKRA